MKTMVMITMESQEEEAKGEEDYNTLTVKKGQAIAFTNDFLHAGGVNNTNKTV